MVRYCTFLLAAAVPFLLTCINADDPFTEIENAIGELNISSPSGIPTDSLYYDSTGNPITISATLFLPSLIDSGVVTLHYQNGDSETILAELFGGDDGTDNRTLDTTLAFLRGGRIVVKMKSYIRGGYSSTDNAEMYLYRTPVRLSLLSIAGVTLTPPFNDTSVTYAATVANDRPFISIIPSIDNPYVRIFINGDTVSPNEAAKPCSLKVGANGFIVKTITDDDTTAFSYTVTVTRLPGTVATLDSISLSTGALDPAFDSATLSGYSATVEYETDTLSITAYPTHPAVTVSIDSGSGEAGKYAYRIPLEVGENPLTVKVTAEDGVTRKEYRVTVTRGKSADASLASVTLSTGTLTPEFRGDTLDYRVNIAHEVDSLAVTPVTTHSAASVTINDSAIAPGGHPWNYFPNTGVEDTVTVSVIAQDGVTERTYHLFILRPPDTTADLAEIPLSKGTLTPEFHADTIRYQVSLQSADSVVTISPKCVDENANAAIDGDTVPQTITLSTGTDSIAITVTAEDGETEKTYTVLFDRARCSDAGLALLSTSAGTLIPEFDADVKDYAVTVDESVDTTVITAQPRHDGATVKINGIDSPASITLQPMAATIVTAVVIAEDGETKSTYKITVTRKGSDLASLVGIELSAGRLVPAFDGDTLAYELRVPSDSGKIRVKPSPVHSRATVTVKGTSVGTGTWSQDITAAPGNNTSFDIVVISETGKQQKTYHIVVNRAYVLTVSNDGNGTTDPAGSVDAFIGVPQAIKAEPAIGYNFIEWTTVSGTADIAAPGDTSTSVLVQSSATIEARFELKKYLLAVTSGGNGTVEGGDTVRHGIADTIAATPADGFHFSGWRVLSGKMRMEDSLVATTTAILENGDAEVQAEFSINDYQLTVTSEGHGTVSGTGPVTHGIAKTVTAIPDTGYHFVVWKVTEGTATIADTTDASTIVTLESGDATVEGVFEINKYIVTYNGNGNTGGSLPADTSYDFGATVTVSDAGDLKRTGYTFTGWNTAADGSGTSYSPSETFTMGTSPVPLYAQWSVNQYFVAHVGNGQTSGAPHDTDFYDFGESVTIVDQGSLFREGYTFTGWNTAADGSGTDHLPSTTFAMGAASIILYAQWSVNQYFVAYVGNGHTAGAPHDTDFYDFGESVTI
ncbi:MAG: cadherin-like beta sandwich domain-containing protein, partial [Chitinispirillaceae bacterium]|nr:cadherin-like beta sandwich domain-containing protein [Chitinispirillaceae bacterium]